MGLQLDTNERAFLAAFAATDPDAESWYAGWAPDIVRRASDFGADAAATSFEGAVQVCRRLCQRKLLEGNTERGKWRGYSITPKGKKALTT